MFIPTTEQEKENYRKSLLASEALLDGDKFKEKERETIAGIMTLSYSLALSVGWKTASRLMLACAKSCMEMRELLND